MQPEPLILLLAGVTLPLVAQRMFSSAVQQPHQLADEAHTSQDWHHTERFSCQHGNYCSARHLLLCLLSFAVGFGLLGCSHVEETLVACVRSVKMVPDTLANTGQYSVCATYYYYTCLAHAWHRIDLILGRLH